MEIAKNKYYKNFNSVNRYGQYPFYYNTEDKRYFGGITNHLKDTTAFVFHNIKEGDTLDSLSLYYYGNPTRYWIIADFNRIQDPFIELIPGEKIKIPSFADIQFIT